jgi:hypothetical protein
MEPSAEVQREQVARAVRAGGGRLRRGGPDFVLAVLAASALVPVAMGMAAGGTAAAGVALAGMAGNVGSGVISTVLDRAVERWRRRSGEQAPPQDAMREELTDDLLAALRVGGATARELSAELVAVLDAIGGVDTALETATGELHDHLAACFSELADQQHAALAALDELGAGQRRQADELRRLTTGQRRQAGEQRVQLEEIADRLRLLSRMQAQQPVPPARSGQAPDSGARVGAPVFGPYPSAPSPPAADGGWHGGAEVMIGDRLYLIHDELLAERFTADHSVLLRQAKGQQLVPAAGYRPRYVWLRQAVIQAGPAYPRAQAQRDALIRERELLAGLAPAVSVPSVSYAAEDAAATSLVVTWPSTNDDIPGHTLGERYGEGGALTSWDLYHLLTGLAGLCNTLARLHARRITHRYLTSDAIIIADRDRLILRDLGLAAYDAVPGEGPDDYQAPEQSRRGHPAAHDDAGGPRVRVHPGPATDVYQVAAIAYHLITRRLPDKPAPLPARVLATGLPEEASRALDAALTPSPADRPDVRALGNALRAASRDLA